MSFRSAIGTAALINIKAFLEKFKTPELVEGYVKSGLIYHGEIPFLYRVFEPLAVRSSTERGKYKVVSVFPPFAVEKSGAHVSSDSPGGVPEPSNPRYHVGLLWETRHQGVSPNDFITRKKPRGGTCAHLHRSTDSGTTSKSPHSDSVFLQIERSLLMHSTGYYIKDERPFSEKFWGHRTAIYIKLAKELSDSRWDGFYAALAYTEGFHEKQSEFSKPVQRWTDDPDEYFIAGSDPADAE